MVKLGRSATSNKSSNYGFSSSFTPVKGHVVKNLFVKDKKAKQLWLITVRHDLEFKLTSLGNASFMFS